ncbi:hypothetical protein AMAG_12799 [Allomyces macrogynus ATCC 38327]|uniref:Phosphatidylcholine transfer protein n=1 Tax=Allomyces macrogynus (strain ATCC 38327) TaxID=578462 RepID=A0A0L0T236_ALLM3|nr:hypothetical protein AMAG_12799 [Allomyces macrogynus ATCC 38327]|eukprot:KNE68634.1 hypothetical protein AMAG_12799 [Allomyces macrogynus ATCC 38327]
MPQEVFASTQFDEAMAEFDSPTTDGWEFVTETSELKIYRRLHAEGSGLYEYKTFGTLKGMDALTAYQVYMDLDYRREWDNLKPEYLHVRPTPESESEDHPESVYWRVKFPLMMADRDYILYREARSLIDAHGETCYAVLLEIDEDGTEAEPVPSGVVRVREYAQTVVFGPGAPNPDEYTAVYMHYYDNPETSIPKTVVNWAISSGIPTFLKNLKSACKKYKARGEGGMAEVLGDPAAVQDLKATLDQSMEKAFQL